MAVSVFDLFKVGIGPSSSHTVGPMRAARRFVLRLSEQNLFDSVGRIEVELYGSLAHTGRGHGTDKALAFGLEGNQPATIDVEGLAERWRQIQTAKQINLLARRSLALDPQRDFLFNKTDTLPHHPNGMRFRAYDAAGNLLDQRDYYSVGGGFVVNADTAAQDRIVADQTIVPFPLTSADALLAFCRHEKTSIAELMLRNELAWRNEQDIRAGLLALWDAMKACIDRGCHQSGNLPGGLKVKRRAPALYRELTQRPESALRDPLTTLDWVNLYALAVGEENACGARVVTAPTNGAAGIIPAVALYYERFVPGANNQGIVDFLLTAGAIGILYKENASISGAEVGCQGEVGVACSMAAGGLAAVMGGTPEQVENAAEIGMEHNLGLTCDPVGGLVQIPCIERNAMGAVKAINAARMALRGDGKHTVSLDKVIKTMRQTGADMASQYKETSRGGLAVNVIEC